MSKNENHTELSGAIDLSFDYQIDDSGLNALLHTTPITDEMIKTDPMWAAIKKMYSSPRFEVRALAATLNSIMTQQRIFFVISRTILGKLIASDDNIPTRSTDQVKFETEYKKYLRLLFDEIKYPWFRCHLHSKKHSKGSKGNAYVFEIIFENILQWIETQSGESRDAIFDRQVIQSKQFIYYPTQVERVKTELTKLIADYLTQRIADEKGINTHQRTDRFRHQIRKIIFAFIMEVDGDQDSIDKLTGGVDLDDSCVHANFNGAIAEGLERFNGLTDQPELKPATAERGSQN